MTTEFTPTDEKVLAGYYAWIALVRTLQNQGVLDMALLNGQLADAIQNLNMHGETGAAEHVESHRKHVERLRKFGPHIQEKG